MPGIVILDTGPLVALLDAREQHHAWAVRQVEEIELPVWTGGAVMAEACFLLARHPHAIARLAQLIKNAAILSIDESPSFWSRAFSLMERYANVPMAFADACIVAFIEQHVDAKIFTLDRDFQVYRRGNGEPISVIAPYS